MTTTSTPVRRAIVILLLVTLAPALATPAWAAEALQVRMLLVAPSGPEYASHRNGAVLGQTEGNIQGRFLGIDYVLDEASVEDALQAGDGISAVIVAAAEPPEFVPVIK